MPIQHTTVLPGDGLYLICKRLVNNDAYWNKLTQAQKDAYAGKLAAANGFRGSGTAVYANQILHYHTEDFVVATPPPPPPTERAPRAIPFVATSPFNTPIPVGAQSRWLDFPILHHVTEDPASVPVTTPRNWFAGEGQLYIAHGYKTDPLWTISMPDFGSDHPTFNRFWKAATWQMRCPAEGPKVGTVVGDDIVVIVDETTGDYLDLGNASGYTIDPVAKTIIGTPGVWWARGNVDTGLGHGHTLASGGNSAGVRAANFSWMAGAITQYDIDQVLTGKKTDFGHALCVMLTAATLSTWGFVTPATAPNNGWNNGPIKMGARIGIPANVSKPSDILATDLLGNAYWNTLQKYGAFVGDYSGGPWPIFQIDSGSVSANSLNSIWIWWGEPGIDGTKTPAPKCVPYLRVLEG